MTGCLKKHPVFSLIELVTDSLLTDSVCDLSTWLTAFFWLVKAPCFNQTLCLHSELQRATDESNGGLSCHSKSRGLLRIAEEENHHAKAAVGGSRSLVWDVRCYPNYLRARAG